MSSLEEIRVEREKKRDLLTKAGMEPYAVHTGRTHEIDAVNADFDTLQKDATDVTIAGRIMSLRRHGGSAFADLYDGTGEIQTFFSRGDIGEESFALFTDAIDPSDFIEVTGTVFLTKQNARAVAVKTWRVLTKALQAVPSEFYGIKDEEERYRKRYLDILLNDGVRDIVEKRARFWQSIRTFLTTRGFVEVETPALETTPGGAEARPFSTHHNALDIDVYLRISAGELWQKKLMVAGMPKTFEIGRIFRNEGMSAEHLQDYTQMEFYEAYADYEKGMERIKELYRTIAADVFGTTKFSIHGFDIDLAGDWQMYDYCALMREHYDIDVLDTSREEVLGKLSDVSINHAEEEIDVGRGVDMLWKKVRKELAGPGFLINVPVFLEPLAKRSPKDERIVERFQVVIAGSEIGKGFSELNDPEDQRERFMQQQKLRDAGDEEAQMADMEYVEALEYGMPPTFGFGLSERLFAFLMDKPVRETQTFPLMRPVRNGEHEQEKE